MINLKITGQCVTVGCNHDLHLTPVAEVPGAYATDCAGCGATYQAVVLTPDELAWHDAQVVAAVAPEHHEKAAKK